MSRGRALLAAVMIGLTAASAAAQDEQGWDELIALAEGRQAIESYTADFRQEKFTPLLRDPIVSRGRVVMLDGEDGGSRWDTGKPYASVMIVAGGELRLYYPDQNTLEVYDLGDRLDAMASSPVPDLDVLRENFSLESSAWNSDRTLLQLVLRPKSEAMQEALQEVEVDVDGNLGALRRLSMTDLDDETTVMHFENIQLNPAIEPDALEFDLPADTKIVRPLDAVER